MTTDPHSRRYFIKAFIKYLDVDDYRPAQQEVPAPPAGPARLEADGKQLWTGGRGTTARRGSGREGAHLNLFAYPMEAELRRYLRERLTA